MILLVFFLLLCVCFFVLRYLYRRFWNKGLSCRINFQEEYAVEDDVSVLTEVLSNHKFLPLPVVEIDFHMDRRLRFSDEQNSSVSDQSYRRDVFALSVRQKITRTLEFKCAGRGYFRINEVGITARDLLLTEKYLSSQPQYTEFYVLPRPVPEVKLQVPFSRIMGTVLSRKKIYDDPFEFAGLREYSRGDPMKYINWKATARAGELLTNLHESTLSQKITLLVDMEGRGLYQSDPLNEAGVRVACSLSEKLLSAGMELSLYSNGRDVLADEIWRAENVVGAGSSLSLKKKFACLESGNGLAPICQCLPGSELRKPGEEDLLILVTHDQKAELLEEFSQAVGKGRGVAVIPFRVSHEELASPRNIDLVWLEV